MELVGGHAEPVRIPADLVQRRQPDVAVESGVLDALRHHGAGRLLPARYELVVAALLEQRHASQLVRENGVRVAVLPVDLAAPRLDVRAVDVEQGGGFLEPRVVVERPKPLELVCEGRARLLELRLVRDLRE